MKHEQLIEEAREEYRQAATALGQPFKHEEALAQAKWDVERIDRVMRGEPNPEPNLGAELTALQRSMRASFPSQATAQGLQSDGTEKRRAKAEYWNDSGIER